MITLPFLAESSYNRSLVRSSVADSRSKMSSLYNSRKETLTLNSASCCIRSSSKSWASARGIIPAVGSGGQELSWSCELPRPTILPGHVRVVPAVTTLHGESLASASLSIGKHCAIVTLHHLQKTSLAICSQGCPKLFLTKDPEAERNQIFLETWLISGSTTLLYTSSCLLLIPNTLSNWKVLVREEVAFSLMVISLELGVSTTLYERWAFSLSLRGRHLTMVG